MIELTLVENDSKSFEKAMQDEMNKAIKHFEGELIKIRTGRAHTSLIEDIQVSCYGAAAMPLKNLASIAAPESRLLTIQPWDAGIIPDIERAIRTSDLGVSPINDGALIRIQLPEMSATRRDELGKILAKKLEESRVSIRNIRKDFNNIIRDAKKDKVISENFFSRLSDILEKITGNNIDKVEKLAQKKEQDIRTV
ncbi:MAG TPA: ribosome recycling factor [Candidatus Dependentiae bacterium]|nr:ribosome recycling factor [Candidatus Dependentiae bacterium]